MNEAKRYLVCVNAEPLYGVRGTLGRIDAKDRTALDVCMLSCVSLLCGLQGAHSTPTFTIWRESDRPMELAATLENHLVGWLGTDGEPFNVEAL